MSELHFQEQAELTRLTPSLAAACPAGSGISDARLPLTERLAAGMLLAAAGEPRITTVPAMTRVPGGVVEIGLPAGEVDAVVSRWRHVGVERAWIDKEVPAFTVELDDVWMGTYPVTNCQYRDFLLATGWDRRPSTWYLGAYPWDRPAHPVCGISADDAEAYLAWLSARTGHPYRLPSEAEWEHAAKGWEGREFPWGNEFDPACANTRETGIHTTTPVGAFPGGSSPFGLADMAGNAEEYVADWYAPYPGGRPVQDHLTDALGSYRVTRGGSFARYGDLARTRRRHGAFPGPLYPCGFRVASGQRPLGGNDAEGNRPDVAG
jgi:formylglycine-generating enzyme required for sulfatase activity